MNRKVLVVADTNWWVFDKIYRGIKDNLSHWTVDVCYTKNGGVINHIGYPIVLFLCDYQYQLIAKNNIPREKLILAIRSNVRHEFYKESSNLVNAARIIAVSNQKLYDRFIKMHPNVVLLPGGVDTDKFYFLSQKMGKPIRVGWAGSSRNFGVEFRGLHIIKKACEQLGFVFNPAIREEGMRNEDGMVKYYHDEIDIYVDMSAGAGRQNGLLEAGSCGLPVISSNVGIAESLIINGQNGFICERKVGCLVSALQNIIPIAPRCGRNIRDAIEKGWSWKAQSKMFEEVFMEMLKPTEIELNLSPNDRWDLEYVDLLEDPFIKKKYNRRKRLQDKSDYIDEYLPIVKKGGGYVLDIGPGPGEFLEICRFYGNKTIGIDCKYADCNMMGRKYHRLSELLAQRQCIDIKYDNFESYIESGRIPFNDCTLSVINSQGAIEQVFREYMQHATPEREDGWTPTHEGTWIINDKLTALFDVFFKEMARVLIVGGKIMIFANGSTNYKEYHKMVTSSIAKAGNLKMVHTDSERLHKVTKIS